MDTQFIIICAAFIALAVLLKVIKMKPGSASGTAGADQNYALRPSILSPAERSFSGVLEPLLPERFRLLVKVRLGDVFVTRKGLNASKRSSAWNRINQKHVDFLIVRANDFTPVAGIELDDRSHQAENRKRRDAFVDDVCKSAELPILHVPAQSTYNPDELRSTLAVVIPN